MFHVVIIYHSIDLNHYQTQTQSLKLPFTVFDSGFKELFVFYHRKLLKGLRLSYRLCQVLVGSLRSKRFRLVSAQKKTVENFRFWPREKWNKNQKMKEGEGKGKKGFLLLSSPPPPRSFACAIFRALFDSRSSFFSPRPHSNACYAGYLVGNPGGQVGGTPGNGKVFFQQWPNHAHEYNQSDSGLAFLLGKQHVG